MPAETSAGLVGPIIIYNAGAMNSTMSSHREFVVNYMTTYEAQSMMAGTNAAIAGLNLSALRLTNSQIGPPHTGNETFWVPQLANFPEYLLSDAQAPIFYTLNGWVFSNGPSYEMCRDDPTLWYVMVSQWRHALSSTRSADIGLTRPSQAYGAYSHVFHMHGNNFEYNDQWQATLSINDGETFTLSMNAQLPGVWQLICHVANHFAFGMQQNYVVYETEGGQTCPLKPLTAKLAGSP